MRGYRVGISLRLLLQILANHSPARSGIKSLLLQSDGYRERKMRVLLHEPGFKLPAKPVQILHCTGMNGVVGAQQAFPDIGVRRKPLPEVGCYLRLVLDGCFSNLEVEILDLRCVSVLGDPERPYQL